MASADTIEQVNTVTKVAMRPPSQFDVILFNDDKTSMEFVVLILMTIFHKSFEDATTLTLLIHELGQGVAGTYNLEIANQKKDDTVNAARLNGFPLICEVKAS